MSSVRASDRSATRICSQLGELRLMLEARDVAVLERQEDRPDDATVRDMAEILGAPTSSRNRMIAVLVGGRRPLLLGETVELSDSDAPVLPPPAMVAAHFEALGLKGIAVVDGVICLALEGGEHVE